MGIPLYTNNAATTLLAAITAGDGSLTVATGTGALFPSPTGSDYAWLTLTSTTGTEIVKCTSRSGDTFTITRGQQSTAALPFAAGDALTLRVTAEGLTTLTAATTAGYATVQEEGSTLIQRTTINFVGTGITATDNVGLAKTDVTLDATLNSLAALGTAADKMAYTTGIDAWAEAAITAAGRAILDDANAAAQRTTLGAAALAGLSTQAFSASNFTTAQGLQFPATQNPSADVNNLDDYEEGTWTPVLTFATPGDLSVTYSTQSAIYTKIGRQVFVTCNLVTSAFTHTTASGALRVTGLPFTSAGGTSNRGALDWAGITKATFTEISAAIGGAVALVDFVANGSAVGASTVTATDCPTGGTMRLIFSATYHV